MCPSTLTGQRSDGPGFIGLGAQRSGTSWLYACLYEHPQIYVPVKELHFFSRERNWNRGYSWYERQFTARPSGQISGEFSTSYLAHVSTPERIYRQYPNARLIVSLRDPVTRAYSSYLNDIMAGVVSPTTSFRDALSKHDKYIDEGRYASQMRRYLSLFKAEQILILIYEDIGHDARRVLKQLFQFLGVDARFHPSMAGARVNAGRIPQIPALDRIMAKTSAYLAKFGLGGVWWFAKRRGLGALIRRMNTTGRNANANISIPGQEERALIRRTLDTEIRDIRSLVGRDLNEWNP